MRHGMHEADCDLPSLACLSSLVSGGGLGGSSVAAAGESGGGDCVRSTTVVLLLMLPPDQARFAAAKPLLESVRVRLVVLDIRI